jgi:hypothetical protein
MGGIESKPVNEQLLLLSTKVTEYSFNLLADISGYLLENKQKILQDFQKQEALYAYVQIMTDENQHSKWLQYFTIFLLYSFQNIRYDEKTNKYYEAIDVQLEQKLPLTQYIKKYNYSQILKYFTCKNSNIVSRFNTQDSREFINYICENADQTINFITYLTTQKVFKIRPREGFSAGNLNFCVDSINNNDGILSINEFATCVSIMKSLINDKLTNLITSNRQYMFDLLHYVTQINASINNLMGTLNQNYVVLKGGNVFKVSKEMFLTNLTDNIQIFKARNIYNINSIVPVLEKMKNNLPNQDLSDWDFSVKLQFNYAGTQMHDIMDDIFKDGASAKSRIDSYDTDTMTDILTEYSRLYETINKIIIDELKKFASNEANANLWVNRSINIANTLMGELTSAGIENIIVKPKTSVKHTHMYLREYNDQFNSMGLSKRNAVLSTTRKVPEFLEQYNKCRYFTDEIESPIGNLKISDMEIYGFLKHYNSVNEDKFVEGFDLIRMTLSFSMDIPLFGKDISDVKYTKTVFGEIYDFSHSKPFTLESWTSGHNPHEFEDLQFRQNIHEGAGVNFVQIKGYSLYWFINDIIRMSQDRKSRKYDKRIGRLHESLAILFVKYYTSPGTGHTIVDFVNEINEFTGKNLAITVDDVTQKADVKPEFFSVITEKLFGLVRQVQGGVINIKQMPEMTRVIVVGIIIAVIAIVIICLIFYMFDFLYVREKKIIKKCACVKK